VAKLLVDGWVNKQVIGLQNAVKSYFSRVKAAGHEANDSPQFIEDAKNGRSVLPLSNMS
jgi:hypothetical protein